MQFTLEVMLRLRSSMTARALCGAVITPLLLVALAGAGRLALRCTLTGALLPESCCDRADEDVASADQANALTAPSCCERVRVEGAHAPALVASRCDERPLSLVALPPALTIAISPFADPSAAAPRPARPGEPPRLAPASFLLRHSFLI